MITLTGQGRASPRKHVRRCAPPAHGSPRRRQEAAPVAQARSARQSRPARPARPAPRRAARSRAAAARPAPAAQLEAEPAQLVRPIGSSQRATALSGASVQRQQRRQHERRRRGARFDFCFLGPRRDARGPAATATARHRPASSTRPAGFGLDGRRGLPFRRDPRKVKQRRFKEPSRRDQAS